MKNIIRFIKLISIAIITFFIFLFIIAVNIENSLLGATLTIIALFFSFYLGIRLSKPKNLEHLKDDKETKSNIKIPIEFEIKINNNYSGPNNIDYRKKTAVSKNKEKLKSIKNLLPGSFVVIDFETTGLDPFYDKIIEIGAVKYIDGEEVGTFSTLINPKVQISSQITAITGITDNMVKDAPAIENVINDFIEFIDTLPLVAHNAAFDLKFLLSNLYDANIEISNPYIDTLYLCRRFMPNLANHKLGTVCSHLCINQDNAHRALDDCRATAQVYLHCRDYELNNKGSIYGTGTRENAETTEFELALFEKVKNILDEAGKSTDYLDYIDTKSNFSIVLIGSDCYVHELMKFTIGAKKMYFTLNEYNDIIYTPEYVVQVLGENARHELDSKNRVKILFNSVEDIEGFSKLIINQYDNIEKMITKIS